MRLRLPGNYCVDTCALIDLSRWHPRDVFPSLWSDLEKLISTRCLIAPDEVLRELRPKDDALCNWAKSNKRMFVSLTKGQVEIAREIVHSFPKLIDQDKTIADADPFVIALARTDGCSVVTSEQPGNGPKIPDVCDHYKIECLSLVELFRQENWEY